MKKPGKSWCPLICHCGQQVGWYNPLHIARWNLHVDCTHAVDEVTQLRQEVAELRRQVARIPLRFLKSGWEENPEDLLQPGEMPPRMKFVGMAPGKREEG